MTDGPGTRLKHLLARYGFTEFAGCNCAAHVAQMDRRGADWCKKNIEVILTWLEAAARAKGHLFVRSAVRPVVQAAIDGDESWIFRLLDRSTPVHVITRLLLDGNPVQGGENVELARRQVASEAKKG